VTSGPAPLGTLGDFLSAGVNANVGSFLLSPIATGTGTLGRKRSTTVVVDPQPNRLELDSFVSIHKTAGRHRSGVTHEQPIVRYRIGMVTFGCVCA
jgi:hypothetical protein